MEHKESQWTVDTLKEHIEKIMAEKDKRLDVVHESAKDAVKVAYDEASKRLTEHNGLLQKMEKQSETFGRKEDVEMLKQWKESSQGSIKIILWLVGVGVTVMIGIAIAMFSQGVHK